MYNEGAADTVVAALEKVGISGRASEKLETVRPIQRKLSTKISALDCVVTMAMGEPN